MNDIVLSTAKQYGYNEAQIDIIRQMAAQGCDDYELAQLLIVAHQTGLNPLLRQIYMIKRWNAAQRREVAMPQTSIDGYRATADRTGKYAPGREPTFTYNDAGELLSATAYIKKLAGGTWHEVAATAYWNEYVQTSKDGKVFGTWAKMPHVMLSKCAEALAIRRAFPAELSGVYTADEMGQADNPPAVTVERQEEVQEAAPARVTREQLKTIATLSEEYWGNDYKAEGARYVMERFNRELKDLEWWEANAVIEALRAWLEEELDEEEVPT